MVNIIEIMIDSSMYRHAYWILRAMQEEKPQEESIQIMVQELGKYDNGIIYVVRWSWYER